VDYISRWGHYVEVGGYIVDIVRDPYSPSSRLSDYPIVPADTYSTGPQANEKFLFELSSDGQWNVRQKCRPLKVFLLIGCHLIYQIKQLWQACGTVI
jgi:hypothetical protein